MADVHVDNVSSLKAIEELERARKNKEALKKSTPSKPKSSTHGESLLSSTPGHPKTRSQSKADPPKDKKEDDKPKPKPKPKPTRKTKSSAPKAGKKSTAPTKKVTAKTAAALAKVTKHLATTRSTPYTPPKWRCGYKRPGTRTTTPKEPPQEVPQMEDPPLEGRYCPEENIGPDVSSNQSYPSTPTDCLEIPTPTQQKNVTFPEKQTVSTPTKKSSPKKAAKGSKPIGIIKKTASSDTGFANFADFKKHWVEFTKNSYILRDPRLEQTDYQAERIAKIVAGEVALRPEYTKEDGRETKDSRVAMYIKEFKDSYYFVQPRKAGWVERAAVDAETRSGFAVFAKNWVDFEKDWVYNGNVDQFTLSYPVDKAARMVSGEELLTSPQTNRIVNAFKASKYYTPVQEYEIKKRSPIDCRLDSPDVNGFRENWETFQQNFNYGAEKEGRTNLEIPYDQAMGFLSGEEPVEGNPSTHGVLSNWRRSRWYIPVKRYIKPKPELDPNDPATQFKRSKSLQKIINPAKYARIQAAKKDRQNQITLYRIKTTRDNNESFERISRAKAVRLLEAKRIGENVVFTEDEETGKTIVTEGCSEFSEDPYQGEPTWKPGCKPYFLSCSYYLSDL